MERLLVKLAIVLGVIIVPSTVLLIALHHRMQEANDYMHFRATNVTVEDLSRQIECMTRNVYYEAAHEPIEGKLAVAQIVMNRVASPDFPDDPCQVIYQKTYFNKKVTCQFSWLCDGSVARHPRIREDLWLESRAASKKVLLEGWRLPSLEHALYYHADYVNPRWRLDRVAKIGRHIFYQPRDV
jgi:spore germination cell wall hydrolase CwlJ-like protein